ncbi:MAG: TetR family transcriptional regulator [Bryobacteraceae bacterium]
MVNSPLQASKHAADPIGRTPSLKVRKQELVRNAIWDAAIDLFAQKGFDETTVDDIVEAAGVSRRSFFRYFASKNDLLTQRGAVTYEALVTEAVRSCPPSYSIPEVLQHTVLEVARHSAAEPRTRKIIEIANKYPSARAALSQVEAVHYPLAEAFAGRLRKGSKRDWTADLLAGLTMAVIRATMRAWFENAGQDISITVDQVLTKLGRIVCEDNKPNQKNDSVPAASGQNGKRSR